MKKRLLMMSGLLVLVLALGFYQVAAKTQATAIAKPTITFDEEQAICICKVGITADSGGRKITATIRLWEDGRCVGTWKEKGEGVLQFSETVPALPGSTYRLTVRVSIDGRRLPTMSVENVYQ